MYDPERCMSCKYGIFNDCIVVCEYILFEGHRRGCYDGDVCTKYEKWDHKRRKYPIGKGVELYGEEHSSQ